MTDKRTVDRHSHGGHHHAPHAHGDHVGHHHHDPVADAGKVKDPVCGMMVDPHATPHRAQYEGKPYYFCSSGCQSKFMAESAKYVEPAAARKSEPVPEGTIYTCPMHPQIRQVGPGSCPICGMALEPVLATAETGPSHELVDMTRRFWIGLALSLPVVALEMGGHLTRLSQYVGQQTSNWIQMLLATPVVLWAGWPFFVRAWQSLVTRNLNMFTLIAMGTGVAWIYSMVATLAPDVFPAAFRGHDGSVAVYFEAAAVITVLVLLGQVLELRARETALIDEYLHHHRPVLLRGHNELWLFPGETGSFKTPSMFSEQITSAVEKATGLRVRTHQFRHAAAALILKREPGNYEFVRRILGHKSLKTTTKLYIGLESFTATERFSEIVDSHLDGEEE